MLPIYYIPFAIGIHIIPFLFYIYRNKKAAGWNNLIHLPISNAEFLERKRTQPMKNNIKALVHILYVAVYG